MLPQIEHLKNLLSLLPGIGSKSALRLAFFLIDMPEEKLNAFLEDIRKTNKEIIICSTCHNYSLHDPCNDCDSQFGDGGLLCVVESAFDIPAFKKFLPPDSKFHVLGGKLSPLNGITPDDLNIENLIKRLNTNGLKEVILAMGADVEGEATASYLMNLLINKNIRTSRIGFGVSVGSSIGLSDERSIQKSLSNRIFY
ncbi:MAG: Recombination protein recR [uncultured bacterium]|nr:MAG: Recombination protein recR [uncultured bacterium]